MHNSTKMAVHTTLTYCVLASIWIILSDRFLPYLASTSSAIVLLATFKGLLFVVVTSAILYFSILALTRSQCTRCHALLNVTSDALIVYESPSGMVVDANRKAAYLSGVWDQWFQKATHELLDSFEWEFIGPDGSKSWVSVRMQPVVLHGNDRMIAIVNDITANKLAELSLVRMNRIMRMLLKCNEILTRAVSREELCQAICTIIVDSGCYSVAWVSQTEEAGSGSCRARTAYISACSGTPLDTLDFDQNVVSHHPVDEVLLTGKAYLVRDVAKETRFTAWQEEAQRHGFQSVLSVPLKISDVSLGALTVAAAEKDAFADEEFQLMIQLAGDLAYGIAALDNETERHRIADALRKSEKNLAEAQAIAALGSWEYDLETDEEYRSDEFFRILGLTPVANGRASDSVFDYIHPDDRQRVLERISDTLEKGMPYDVEYRIIRADGSERMLRAQGKTELDKAGKATKFIGTAYDITERKSAEHALRESELRFRSLVETSTDWIWATDENEVYVYSSPKIGDLLGYEPEEVLGRKPFDLLRSDLDNGNLQVLQQRMAERKAFTALEFIVSAPDGNLVAIESSGMPVFDSAGIFCGYRGIDRDISDRKKLEEKYLHAQKMEAVGQLAGGIAHDFNNILTAIIGFQHLLFEALPDDKTRYYARQVLTLAEKAALLTNDLLAFSRKQTICPRNVNINTTISNIAKILKRLLGEDVELRLNLHDTSLPVLAVAGHMEQIFMNLATNARDAMPNGGLLTITTEIFTLDRAFVAMHRHGKIGDYALVTFSDTGTGMDETTKRRIFEPFFTTKEVGKGTGLGLSTVYGLVQQHEGFINVYSEKGEGTTFRIYLPLTDDPAACDQERRYDLPPPHGNETILLVEDEQAVRQVMGTLLEKSGYQVVVAVDGEHALQQYAEHGEMIDLLILDVIMPKMNGKDVFEIINKTRNDVKTLFISGYTADILEQKGIPENCHLVSKPVSPHDFLWKVRTVLDTALSTPAGC